MNTLKGRILKKGHVIRTLVKFRLWANEWDNMAGQDRTGQDRNVQYETMQR